MFEVLYRHSGIEKQLFILVALTGHGSRFKLPGFKLNPGYAG
jgi:hypothetical protein